MTEKNLFRSEAIDAHRPRLDGTVVLRSSPVWAWLSLAVASVAMVAVCALCLHLLRTGYKIRS